MNQIEKDLVDLLDLIEKMNDNDTIKDLKLKAQYIYTRNKIKNIREKTILEITAPVRSGMSMIAIRMDERLGVEIKKLKGEKYE